ncbi:hypothetical protein CPB83DRAFT_863497 [Crepidotus variabilis]|uniref:Uncharacterized protein n=1 Tax=Crepidotus variabilis TaxID=179855 RepID=A0A9P6E5T5_9AGAR|nr:hypothetical protein CPB83DRAFT_863497 [Crepidotus variabilis]
MDNLLNEVFASTPNLRERLHRVLAAIVVLEYPTVATLSDLLELDTPDVVLAAHKLGAIVEIEELPTLPPTLTEFPIEMYISAMVSFTDSSWEEFLTDKSSAGDLWVDSEATYQMLLKRADYLLSKSISPSPIAMHRSTWTAIFQYLTRLWAEPEDESPCSWKDSWPLFGKALEKFRFADSAQQRSITLNPQSVRTFRLFLRCCQEKTGDEYLSEEGENCKTAQSVIVAALREWFEDPASDSHGMFVMCSYLFNSETTMWTGKVQEISEQPHLSRDTVLRIIDQSRGFIDLDTGNKYDFQHPASHALRVCVDWSLMDVIENSDLVGPEFFTSYREVRICALRDSYEEFLSEQDPAALKRKAWGLFLKPMRNPIILTLDPDIDHPATSSLWTLIDRIRSPQSLAVLLSPDLDYNGCHSLFIPLMSFVTLNCQKASTLGPNFEALDRKLRNLFTVLIQNGALAAAFAHPDYQDARQQRHNMTMYRNISNLEGFDQGRWLDLIDSTSHTTILEFFLGGRLVECFYGWKPASVSVESTESSKIVELLSSLRLKLQGGGPRVISKYKPLLSWGSFVDGLKCWQEKYVERNSNTALVLDELCAQLSSIDWPSILNYEDEYDESEDEDTDEESGEHNVESDDDAED